MSRYKGGTLIDEDVDDLESHERRVCDPDGYRPEACPTCSHRVLHVHSYRERHPRGEVGLPPVVRIVQYVCAREDCGATWRVLPRFLARHLWWVWEAIEQAVRPEDDRGGRGVADSVPVPEQTRRRWRARLAASARVLVALLAARGDLVAQAVAAELGCNATRAELVRAYAERRDVAAGERLARVATLSDRLERGVRLM